MERVVQMICCHLMYKLFKIDVNFVHSGILEGKNLILRLVLSTSVI